MNRCLVLLFLLALSPSMRAAPNAVTSVALNRHSTIGDQPYFLIDADEVDGNETTNRHKIGVDLGLNLPSAGTYTPRLRLLRAHDQAVVASVTGSSITTLVSGTRSVTMEIDPVVQAAASTSVSGLITRVVSFSISNSGEGYLSAPEVVLSFTVAGQAQQIKPTVTLDGAGGIASIADVTLPPFALESSLALSIAPPPPLDPNETYLINAKLNQGGTEIGSANAGAAARWIHFTGLVAGSSSRNMHLDLVGPVTVSQPHLLRSASASSSAGQFALQIPCRAYRYDSWTSPLALATPSTAQFEITLKDESNNATIALNALGSTDLPMMAPFAVSGTGKAPAVYSFTVVLRFRPTSPETLAFLKNPTTYNTYNISVRELSVGDDWETPIQSESPTLSAPGQGLLPLKGELVFGSAPAISTNLIALNSVTAIFSGPPNITLNVADAQLASSSLLRYNDNSLLVSVDSVGVCYYQEAVAVPVSSTVPAPDQSTAAGISYRRSNYRLDGSGLKADLLVDLPAGVQWQTDIDRDKARYQNSVLMGGVNLNASRAAIGTALYTPASGAVNLTEETKPLRFSGGGLLWRTASGVFDLQGPLAAYSFARTGLAYLKAVSSSLANVDPVTLGKGDFKRSNDLYHANAQAPLSVSISTDGTTGSGQLTVEYGLAASDFRTHMPYDVRVIASSGSVKVNTDLIDSSASKLLGASTLEQRYDTACTGEECLVASAYVTERLTPAGSTLQIGPHGALRAEGVISAPALKWGKRDATNFAHGLKLPFSQGVFLAADSFALAQIKPSQSAFAILNTGYRNSGGSLLPEVPGSAAYNAGLGDYPGLNYRLGVGMALGAEGSSRIGNTSVNYTMRAAAKYYTRLGGVSGIHDAELSAGSSLTPVIYGYSFVFGNFAFNLLGSQMRDSLIEGSISFGGPSDFTQDFEQLQLTCRGELGELTPVGVEKKLRHWDCAFEVLGASFVRSNEEACAGGTGKYLTNIRARSHHVPVALVGALGIHPDGELINSADECFNGESLITSRFVLPRAIEIQGPPKANSSEREIWYYNSVQDAYLSDYKAGETAHSKGFWNLIGTLDVPFFRDLQVHLQTVAINSIGLASDPDSQIHVRGGWPDAGWTEGGATPFTSALFDATNRGLPPATTLEAYRAVAVVPSGAALPADAPDPYGVKAAQTWLEVVDFEYELTWDPVRKTFEAKEVPDAEILVVNIGHNCLRISPDFAEINFGFSYDGLPQVNFSQMAFNAIDDATGAASSLLHTLGSAGFNALTGGVDRFAKLVGDRMDKVIDDHVDAIMRPPLDALDGVLKGKFSAGYAVDSSDVTNAVDAAFGVGSAAAGTVKHNLEQLVNAGGAAVSFSKELVAQLDEVLNALDACANLKHHGVLPASAVEPYAEGLFDTFTDPPNTALQSLARNLVTDMAAAISAAVLNEVWAVVIEKHEDKVIAVEEALSMVYVKVKAVRDEINFATGDFNQELQEIVNAAKTAGEIESAITQAATDIKAAINALSSMDVTVSWDLIKDEQKEAWMQSIKDRLHASPFITKISTAIKERLYDLEGRMHSAIDSGMDALNDILKDAIKDHLAGLDESINNLLGGTLDDIVGAGQIKGYAHITTDSLELLRLDGSFRWMVPDEMKLDAYLEIRSMNSTGDGTCAAAAGDSTEVELGALDVPLEWISPDLRADVSAKFAFGYNSRGVFGLIGFGGGFRMVGELSYETFTITDMQAQIAFGETENYLAAEVGLAFSSYKLKGGIFFGRCCSPDPIEAIDPDVAALIPGGSFTGAYAYGEGWIPIIGDGCFFNISAGVGAGAFYFAEGPTYGGKMLAGVSGEALCAVSIKGEIELIGVKSGGNFSFSGEGRLKGKAGVCPLCVKFSENVRATYSNGSWDVDY